MENKRNFQNVSLQEFIFFIFEATYMKQKVYSYNEHVNRAVGTIVGAIELRRSHKTRNSVKTAT